MSIDTDIPDFGRKTAQACRLFYYILHYRWELQRVRNSPTKGIIDFEVSKLLLLFARIWDELCKAGDDLPTLPFNKPRGKHGPGLALKVRGKGQYSYIVNVLEDYESAKPEAARLLQFIPTGWGGRYVVPHLTEVTIEKWIREGKYSPIELDRLKDSMALLNLLTSEEVIVLGTHRDAKGTVSYIQFEVDHWIQVTGELFAKYSSPDFAQEEGPISEILKFAKEARQYAEEMVKKVSSNRSIYERALEKIVREAQKLGKPAEKLLAVQSRPERIWDDQQVSRLRSPAELTHLFSQYMEQNLQKWSSIRGYITSQAPSPQQIEEIRYKLDNRLRQNPIPQSMIPAVPDPDTFGNGRLSIFEFIAECQNIRDHIYEYYWKGRLPK